MRGKHFERELEKDPHISGRKIKENNSNLFREVSARTVSCRVHELEYTSYRPVKKPILTRLQKAHRVHYAEWLDVLWYDEATFTVTEGRSDHVY